jgi:transposase
MGGQRRLQQRACPPARRRRPQAPGAGGHQRGQVGDQTEALGRSRGGLTTKIHLGCDGRGRPLSVVLTPGQRHDSTQLEPVLDAIAVPRPSGRGRPRKRPDHLVGDKAYRYPTCRRLLRRRGIPHTIPQRSDQRARRAGRPGRPLAFDRERYRGRNVVERCFNRRQVRRQAWCLSRLSGETARSTSGSAGRSRRAGLARHLAEAMQASLGRRPNRPDSRRVWLTACFGRFRLP